MTAPNEWSLRQTNGHPPDCFWCGPDGPCDGGCYENDVEEPEECYSSTCPFHNPQEDDADV